MARPRGLRLNPDAFEDLLEARNMTRTELAAEAGVAASTLSGLSKAVDPCGASLQVALRLAMALRCRPGSLFPAMTKRHADLPNELESLAS